MSDCLRHFSCASFPRMGPNRTSWAVHSLYWVFFLGFCSGAEIPVSILQAPPTYSHLPYTKFVFEVLAEGNTYDCPNCSFHCKLDNYNSSLCEDRNVSYEGLRDGNHTFEVCADDGSGGVGCASYNWTVDTVPPTASVSASTSFTQNDNVSVIIAFSEPCVGGGGFTCSSVKACNLIVYGCGEVIPSTLQIIEPNLTFSLIVGLSSKAQRGRAMLVIDRGFCSDTAGNKFTRTKNSVFTVHFDRRNVFVNLTAQIPEKQLQLHGETRTVQATHRYENLKVYFYSSQPVLNSSVEILHSLHTSQGLLRSITVKSRNNRRFGFELCNLSSTAIVTIDIDSKSIISSEGTAISPVAPLTFLYDSRRPAVKLSTISRKRTRKQSIPVLIRFTQPVFGFNSSHILISGGHLQSFSDISTSMYTAEILADADIVSVKVPENITEDVAENKNLASDVLQVRHYSVPIVSTVLSIFVTTSLVVTSISAGLLAVSTASLQSVGVLFRLSTFISADPARNFFRTVSHVQVFALSRWLAVTLPVEYHEFVRKLQWTIPCLGLPWETKHMHPLDTEPSAFTSSSSSKWYGLGFSKSMQPGEKKPVMDASVYGLPLTPMEYKLVFDIQKNRPDAQNTMDLDNSNGWRDFNERMFWLAVACGGLILLHFILLLLLIFKKKNSKKQGGYGILTLPRFEIFLIILAIPCICQASAALMKGNSPSGVTVGSLFLIAVSFLMLALFLFISIGISLGKRLQYKEVQREGRRFHWYHDIVRATLGPGKKGQWTWKDEPNSVHLIALGPLFEDLRGPPKYMLSQISWGDTQNQQRIITSDDETEDAEAPFIQKVFGILRIYYTLLESVKRVCLGIMAGAHMRNGSSNSATITLLCITSFQLFFLVLKKPFIKKRVQLVEVISVASELGIFATCFALLEKEFPPKDEKKIGIFMLSFFLVGFLTQLANELYALYRQVKQLDPEGKSFFRGLKTALIGLVLLLIPQMIKNLESKFWGDDQHSAGEEARDIVSFGGERCMTSGFTNRDASGSSDRPQLKQLRDLAKASFTGDVSRSSVISPDLESKPKRLYNDLEAIFEPK